MHKIWVADDDAAIRTILEESLNTAGFETTIFPDADSLIDNLNTSQPDLVITDIKMPGTHGYDLLKHLYKSMNHKLDYYLWGMARRGRNSLSACQHC